MNFSLSRPSVENWNVNGINHRDYEVYTNEMKWVFVLMCRFSEMPTHLPTWKPNSRMRLAYGIIQTEEVPVHSNIKGILALSYVYMFFNMCVCVCVDMIAAFAASLTKQHDDNKANGKIKTNDYILLFCSFICSTS